MALAEVHGEVYVEDLLDSVKGRQPGDIPTEEKIKILEEFRFRKAASKLGIDPYTGPMFAAPSETPPAPGPEMIVMQYGVTPETTSEEAAIDPVGSLTTAELLERQQAQEHLNDQQRFSSTLQAAGAVAYGGWLPVSGS